jgi:hypothetical protein
MSRLINPHQPYRLEDTSVVNMVPSVCKLQKKVNERKEVQEKMKRAFEMAKRDFQQKFGDYLQQKKVKQELQGPAR